MNKQILISSILLLITLFTFSQCQQTGKGKTDQNQTPEKPTQKPSESSSTVVLSTEANLTHASNLQTSATKIFGTLPEQMPGADQDTPAMIELGEVLYHETKLSISETQSCNTCHRLDDNMAGVDNKPTSPGADGQFGERNAPTVLNAGFQIAQFWDGRAATLEEHAKGHILNPMEMAMPSEKVVMERLSGDEKYESLFKKAFPDQENPVTYDNMAEAIAAFERTLITSDRFDDFLNGDLNALSKEELTGLDEFLKRGCAGCHSGYLLGGQTYKKMGKVEPYENTEDLGRYQVTQEEKDNYVFKTSMLRNVELTQPYFHDGAVERLAESIRIMAAIQSGIELTNEQITRIETFLKALTDKQLAAAN